jgi:hypothetical protein
VTGFSGLTEEICDRAYHDIVKGSVLVASKFNITNKLAGHVLVLKPSIPYEPKYKNAILDGIFDDLVLWDYSFGEEEGHDIPKYKGIARAKGYTSFLTGLPSHLVQQQFPSLYVPGMTKYGGSAVAGPGPMRLITAFSGVQWNFDQMISEMMISAIQALCHEQMGDVMASDEAMILAPPDV